MLPQVNKFMSAADMAQQGFGTARAHVVMVCGAWQSVRPWEAGCCDNKTSWASFACLQCVVYMSVESARLGHLHASSAGS